MYPRTVALIALLLAVLVSGSQALAAPSITITAPTASDTLTVGESFNIQWTTEELDDVRIDFSADNGDTWDNITQTVDNTSPDWLDFPWTPSTACTQCLIKISGYEGEVPTESEVFSIAAASGGDAGVTADSGSGNEDDDDGGCAVSGSPDASLAALLLLGLLVGMRRRR